jgi:hypothetical protein
MKSRGEYGHSAGHLGDASTSATPTARAGKPGIGAKGTGLPPKFLNGLKALAQKPRSISIDADVRSISLQSSLIQGEL